VVKESTSMWLKNPNCVIIHQKIRDFKMRLLLGLAVAITFILLSYLVLGYDLKGYMGGAFGLIFGGFIYYSEATSSASEAIEYTDPKLGTEDIVMDVLRTLALMFVFGFLSSQLLTILLAGVVNVYLIEGALLFGFFTYISFWELKYTVKHTLKAMFMLDRPKKYV